MTEKVKIEYLILYGNGKTGTIKTDSLLTAQLAAHSLAAKQKTIVISVKPL